MRKEILIFAAVVTVSLVAATLGHAYCPAFCKLFKPVTWPFVCLAVLTIRRLAVRRRRRS